MKKQLLATLVAGLFATSASAGIQVPAGEWTLDINGNVNAFATITNAHDSNTVTGGLAAKKDANGESQTQSINTGLLPASLGIGGKSRQNDLDVAFQISMQPNVSDNAINGAAKSPEFRQAYITVGDASWGSVKLGKDLGIFASDAILNDMTLLGVGAGAANSGASTTLGGIGVGYIYPAWKAQVAYTTPNFGGLQATVGITNPNQGFGDLYQDRFGYEGKVSYAFNVSGVDTKVWASGATYDVKTATANYTAEAWDIGGTASAYNATLTAYYYQGQGAGTTFFGDNGATTAGRTRDSDGYYVQGTYVLPTKTKVGVAYGKSNLDLASGESNGALVDSNERITVGAYHPLTKSLNLVAEYNRVESQAHNGASNKSDSYSAGAILFF